MVFSVYFPHTSETFQYAMKFKIYTGPEVRALRKRSELNQGEFWQHFQTSQSGGSRYESGREIPRPVQVLLNIAFGTEAKSAEYVAALRALGTRPKRAKKPAKIPAAFGMLP